MRRAQAFFEFLQPPPAQFDGYEILDDTIILSLGCQKNLQLLRVPDSAAYYKRNVYLHNFTIVQGYSTDDLKRENVTSYVWTENEFGKNPNAIASCVLDKLNEINLTYYKRIRLVSDGCCGQSKNSTMVTAILKWFSESAPAHIVSVELVFPVTGHSFLPPDRVFAKIERSTKRLSTIVNPNDYIEVIKSCGTVKRVGPEVKVYDIEKATSVVMKPYSEWNFSIPHSKRIVFVRKADDRKVVQMKGELFYHLDSGVFFSSYCKDGQRLCDLHYEEIEKGNIISGEKRKDLLELLEKHFESDWRALPSLEFFVYLLDMAVEHDESAEKNGEVEDSCVFIEEQPDLIV